MQTPFKFLDAYSKEDKAIFFGREKETEELYLKVFRTNLVLLYGPSGAGKTSLINCGLANKFDDTDWFQLAVRRQGNHPESIRKSLWEALEKSQKGKRKKAKLPPADASITRLIHEIYIRHFKPIYFIFDQFEELFILGDDDEKIAVIQILKEIVESEVNCTLLLVMREEYLAELDDFEGNIPHIRSNRLRVETMGRGQVRGVVKSMLEVPSFKIEVSEPEQTLDTIVKNINNQGDIHLAYLQVYLDRLYGKAGQKDPNNIVFSPELVEETGKLEGVLGLFLGEQLELMQNALSENYPKLTIEDLWQFLSAFVTVKGTKVPITIEQLTQRTPDIDQQFVRDCLQQLYNRRILRDEDGIYEIAHDSLAHHIAENIGHETRKLREAELLVEDRHRAWELTGALLNQKELDYLAFFEDRLQLHSEMQEFVSKSRRAAKRRRRQLLVGGVAGALIVGLTVFALFSAWKVDRINNSLSLVSKAQSVIETDPTQALDYALQAVASNKNPISEAVLYETFRENNFYQDAVRQSDQILTTAVSPDEQFIAYSKAGASGNRVLYLMNEGGNIIDSLITEDNINQVCFSPSGEYILASADDARAYLWGLNEKKVVSIWHEDPDFQGNINVTAIAFSVKGDFLSSGTETGQVFVYELAKVLNEDTQPLFQIDTLENPINVLAFSVEDKVVLAGTNVGEILWWDRETNNLIQAPRLNGVIDGFHSVADSNIGVISSGDLFSWEVSKDTIIPYFKNTAITLNEPSILSPDGNYILTTKDGNKIEWLNTDGTFKGSFIGHEGDIDDIRYSKNGRTIYSRSEDGSIKKWTLPYVPTLLSDRSSFSVSALRNNREGAIYIGRAGVEAVNGKGEALSAFQPDADRILDISPNSETVVWEFNAQLMWGGISDDSPIFFERSSSIRKAAISPDGSRILSAYYEGDVLLWDTTGAVIQDLSENGAAISMAFSENGKYFVLGGSDGKVSLWTTDNGKMLLDYVHEGEIKACGVSPAGEFLVSVDSREGIKLFDAKSKEEKILGRSIVQVLGIDISSDGQWIGIAKEDGSIEIFDRRGNLYHELAINSIGISQIRFSNDAHKLIVGQVDGNVYQVEILKLMPLE